MMIKCIILRNFRNYREAIVTFSSKINFICGDNAQGKTNLLEALSLLMYGRSFRTSHLSELIHFEENFFHIEALFEKNGIEQTIRFSFNGCERKVVYNATSLPNVSALLGILNGVILSPEDQTLIKGGPQARREFLDLLLAQANPLYLYHLCRYLKAMKQRNMLLKQKCVDTLPIWEEQMAQAATFLTRHRSQTVEQLTGLCQSETLASDKIALLYKSPAFVIASRNAETLNTFFLKQFEKNRAKEVELGMTLSGPHRDDVAILLHGKEARNYASEGQQRSCVSTLKLAQWKWLESLIEEIPALCIDDVGISFDINREKELCQRVANLGQVFITSARASPLDCHVIRVENGCFVS
jgi:DNA replication and repair protein RecF